MSKNKLESILRTTDSPVTDCLILICEKCGKKLDPSDENPAKLLQRAIKDEVKARFGKGKLRPVITGCLDVCPKDEIATAIVRVDGRGSDEFYTIAEDDLADACAALIEKATAAK